MPQQRFVTATLVCPSVRIKQALRPPMPLVFLKAARGRSNPPYNRDVKLPAAFEELASGLKATI